MSWYKRSEGKLHIEQEDLTDRTRMYLMDGEKEVGK